MTHSIEMHQSRQTSSHFIVIFMVRSLSFFFDLILVNSQNHEDTNGRIISIAFELIAGYNLLIEI